MNADMIAAWAVENGFHAIDAGNYRRHDDTGMMTIEIKKMSFLLIDERQGLRPHLISRLFKDMPLSSGSGRLQALLLGRISHRCPSLGQHSPTSPAPVRIVAVADEYSRHVKSWGENMPEVELTSESVASIPSTVCNIAIADAVAPSVGATEKRRIADFEN
jgi:hypothetical protein